MAYETLEIRREESILWLTLNRPHNLNALSAKMVSELEEFLAGLRDDHETRVVIMRGAGRAFCAGLDLKEQNRGGPEALGRSTTAVYESQRRMSDLTVAIRRAPQPFIAAIKGPAAGRRFRPRARLRLPHRRRVYADERGIHSHRADRMRHGRQLYASARGRQLGRRGAAADRQIHQWTSARWPPDWFLSWCPMPKLMPPQPSSRMT